MCEKRAARNGSIERRTKYAPAACRGVFVPSKSAKFRDILDGLSNTICAGELVTDLGDQDVRAHPARIVTANNGGIPQAYQAGGAIFCDQWRDTARPNFWRTGGGVQLHGGAEERRGFKWAHGRPVFTGVTTILPPNGVVCMRWHVHEDGVVPPSSRHQGGCHVLMTDGAVKFITESIEAGNQQSAMVSVHGTTLSPGTPSPFGLWGSLGTRASSETVQGF